MFKIAFKQKPALCNFYLLILFTTTILIIDNRVIDCRVITRRDISIKNETSEVESKILQEENKLLATATTITPIQLNDDVASDLIENEKKIKEEDASTFRTEITTVSETRSESFSIATKTPKILNTSASTTNTITTTKSPIKLINENSVNINSNSIKDNDNSKAVTDTTIIATTTTSLPIDTATTTQISNLNLNNEKSNANILNDIAKENYVKNSEINTETSENVVQTTTQMPDEPDTTIKHDLFRDDSQINIESTTIEPIESMTKIFDNLDYDDMKLKVITSTTEKNQYETLVTTNKYSNNQISIEKEIEATKETIEKESPVHKSELEHKIIKLEAKPKSFKPTDNVLEEKFENELSPFKSEHNQNTIKLVEGRNNKYDDILAEIDIDEKHLEKQNDLKLNPNKSNSSNQEITTISNDLEIPNAAEFWALAGMKTNLQKENLLKLENKTSEFVNIEQDNSTLKHFTDWSKIMEESIDMENSTTALVDDLITTTILPDIEEKSKISIDSISNNLNENSEKEILIKQLPTIAATTTTTTSATVEEVKIQFFNSTTPSNNLNILEEHSNNFGNDSSESISKFNKEKFQSKSSDTSSGSNSKNSNTTSSDNTTNSHDENIKQNLNLNTKLNDNDRIFTNSNASSVKNIYSDLKNRYDKINEENKTMKATEKNDDVDLNLMPKLNTTQEDNNFNKINSSSSSSSSSSSTTTTSTPSSVIELVQNENIINSSEIITKTSTIPPPIILSSSTPSSSSSEFQTTTGTRGLSFDNSLKAHPNKEDIINDLNNTVILNNAFKNNSSDKYLENFYNNSIQQNQNQQQQQQQQPPSSSSTTINRNSNLTENSKLSTAVENSLNENENKNETNSIYTNIINNNNNSYNNNNNKNNSYIEGKENLNNKIILKTNESDINNDINIKKEIFIATTTTTEKQQNKQEEIEAAEEEEDIELKMTSRMDYDDENTTTTTTTATNIIKPTTEFYFDKSSKKNQKYQLNGLSTESPTPSVTTGNENIKKKFTTEKTEKSENAKSTSESSIENDIIEKNQPPTTKSSLFPKLIQPTINPLKNLNNNNNNEEIILENSLDAQSTLQTIPFAKDPTDILIGSPSPSIPTSEINSDPNLNPDLYPKYEVATTSDTKLKIINIDNGTKIDGTGEGGGGLSGTVNGDDKNCDPSSTKIPYSNTIEGLEGAANDTDYNVIIAVSVSVVGIVALILLLGFLIVMRKRQKQTTYGQRCRPVGLDAYSVDNLSLRDSIRGKSFRSSFSKRSYGNVAFDDPNLINNVMSIHELNRFIGKKSGIYDEFKDIPQITAKPDEVPPGCEDKNRYANVIPLPETRVILQQQGGDEKTEYINANYVRGPKDSPNYYIACQAPLESTVPDFWRMIWEQNSRVVIMATDLEENGIEKSAAYIPESMTLDNHVSYGDYQITLKNREVKEKYAVSTLHVKHLKTNAWREITHFWYQWPITGVPEDETPMIAMLLEARSCLKSAANEQIDDEEIIENNDTNTTVTTDIDKKMNGENGSTIKSEQQINESNKNEIGKNNKASSKSQGPLLIHCSPGTGRTGTIIACDIAMRSLETPKRTINIPQIVYYVRRGRASSILTREQYEFIYRVTHMYATKISAPVNDN